MNISRIPADFQMQTVTTSPTSLPASSDKPVNMVLIGNTSTDTTIYYREDGGTITAGQGTPLLPGETAFLQSIQSINGFRAIAASSVGMSVQYFKVNA